ncbi:MAG: hypothetical protein RMK99_17160 [Anaerolineales bacterium]|nr:hypothetical protein [Anaerolineales bacterium]
MAYPDYVHRLLATAREEGQWYGGQYDAAAKCFDVLALFPDCVEAAELVYELFCDEWLIYDMRNLLQQHIDEWDDRPHQQRRRLALSWRFSSRWEGKYTAPRFPRPGRRARSKTEQLLDEAHRRLLEAYCLGDEEATAFAWPLFVEAIAHSDDPRATLLAVGFQYADLGFFGDSVEVLAELCSRFEDEGGRRLLVEVKWWRDNAHRLPWLPPPGDGSRYRRMMAKIDPTAPSDEEVIAWLRERAAERGKAARPRQPSISPELAALVNSALPANLPATTPSLVDWSFLDRDDGEPGELPEWAKRQIKLFGRRDKEIVNDIIRRARYSRPIPPPSKPKRYDPNEPPFDPREIWEDDEFDFDDDDE